MLLDDVRIVLAALRHAGVEVWLDGGWGVDALLEAEHRPHDDLDLVVALEDTPRLVTALAQHSYRIIENHLPTRAVMRDPDGRQVDLHPISFDDAGTGWQAGAMPNGGDCEYPADGFTSGRVGEMVVGCLSAELQVAHHLGYTPRSHDRDDMARLAAHFTIELPAPYARLT